MIQQLDAEGVFPAPDAPPYVLIRRLHWDLVELPPSFSAIQVFHGDWDHHSNIAGGLPHQCQEVDQGSAALVVDLARRGLLDETLVIWGGELGRTPVAQKSDKPDVAAGRGTVRAQEGKFLRFAAISMRPESRDGHSAQRKPMEKESGDKQVPALQNDKKSPHDCSCGLGCDQKIPAVPTFTLAALSSARKA